MNFETILKIYCGPQAQALDLKQEEDYRGCKVWSFRRKIKRQKFKSNSGIGKIGVEYKSFKDVPESEKEFYIDEFYMALTDYDLEFEDKPESILKSNTREEAIARLEHQIDTQSVDNTSNLMENEDGQKFEYMMLSRLQSDCEYFLNYGKGSLNRLPSKNIDEHITYMKELWNKLKIKPEWLSLEDILNYEKEMKNYSLKEGKKSLKERIEGQYRFKVTDEDTFDILAEELWEKAPGVLDKIGWSMDYNNSFPILQIEDLTITSQKNQEVILAKLSTCTKDISEALLEAVKEKKVKVHTILKSRRGRDEEITKTLEQFWDYFRYTLETGKSYEREKGNSKINMQPKNINSLVDNLNKAVNNAAANGCSENSFSYVKTVEIPASEVAALTEGKKRSKKNLKETSHEIGGNSFIMKYDESDIVKSIKELIKDSYDNITVKSIQSPDDTNVFNIELKLKLEEELESIEANRFIIAQKMHKFRVQFATELSSYFSVSNSTISSYKINKNANELEFTLSILLSTTPQRNWVNGQFIQGDKKVAKKLEKLITKENKTSTKK